MLLRIGKGKEFRGEFECECVHGAQEIYDSERDMSGEGASTFPEGFVYLHLKGKVDSKPINWISYNGRIWSMDSEHALR